MRRRLWPPITKTKLPLIVWNLEGDTEGALSRLRDLVNAEISFKELARQTGLGEKSLHRMLDRHGNPTARNLGTILRSIADELKIKSRVEVA